MQETLKTTLFMIYVMLAIAAFGAFVAGPAVAYFELATPMNGFALAGIGMLLGVVVTIIGLIVMFRSGAGLITAVWLLGAVPAGFLLYALIDSRGLPVINDISTELVYPPPLTHAATLPENEGRDMSFPKEFEEIIRESYPDLQPLVVQGSMDDVYGRAYDVAKSQPGWTLTESKLTDKEHVFEGYAESGLFKFRDDFVVRVTAVEGGSACVVEMRSKSRDGKGDFGVNAERIRSFFSELNS